jgi:imidazolonepropionase-like amidohydrolase
MDMLGQTVVRSGHVVDPCSGSVLPDHDVVVQSGRVVAVLQDAEVDSHTCVIDARDLFVVPGLIDAHAHGTAVSADYDALMDWPVSYVTARSVQVLRGMLGRGFTTMRDMGGADVGLCMAVDEGHLDGPRLRVSGKNLSRAEGRGDPREYGLDARPGWNERSSPGVACQDTATLLDTARRQLEQGVHQIKLSVTGGVSARASGPDQIKFSGEEISAVSQLAREAGRYVAAHAYSADSVLLALSSGVRSIEHGNLIDDRCFRELVTRDAFLVPTLVTYHALAEEGDQLGLPSHVKAKIRRARDVGLGTLEAAHRAGVTIAYGTDLMSDMHHRQNEEFLLRATVQPPLDVLRSATTAAARLLQMDGEVGVLAPGALADLLLVDENPLDDVRVLARPTSFRLVMKEGRVYRRAF